MKQHLKDHWYIAIALIAIFVAGNGSGYVFASKQAGSNQSPPSVETASWANATLDSLRRALDLSPEQLAAIRPQVEATAGEVIATRKRTMLEYHRLLLALHDEIGGSLDETQQRRLEKSKSSLEKTINSRFADLIDHPA